MTNFVTDLTEIVNMKEKGTYCLIFDVDSLNFKVRSGKEFKIDSGRYVYVGSAFGSGGIGARLKRHLMKKKKIHWHIDFLTSHESFKFIGLKVFKELKIECEIAGLLSSFLIPVKGFGCTDCRCVSHLFKIPL